MAAEQVDFHQILNSLLSFNNDVRQSAEVRSILAFNYVGIHSVRKFFFFCIGEISCEIPTAKNSSRRRL